MKVPVYQPSQAYRAAYAQNVALARPTQASSRSKKWTDLAQVSRLVQNVAGAVQTLQGKDASQPAAGDSPAPIQGSSAPAQDKAATAFSAPARQEQLNFARTQAFAPQTQQEQKTPLEKLDENFLQMLPPSADEGEEDLLTQDYTVLRREVQHLQERAISQTRQANLSRAESAFIETAAMVRTPQALEQYVNSNLTALKKETQADASQQATPARIQALYAQAVGHNVEAALQAGETAQAKAVYQHFAGKLSQTQGALLGRKISAREADLQGQALWPAARQACSGADGSIHEQALKDFVLEHTPQKDEAYRQDLQDALQARLRAGQRKDLRRKAAGYRLLAQSTDTQDIAVLMGQDMFDAQDFENNQQALRRMQSRPQQASSAETFTRLQRMIWDGQNPDEQAASALKSGQLSAADYWRLKARSASARADGTDARERLLSHALEGFCRQEGLTPQQSREVQYYVFSADGDWQARLQAAHTVRQIFKLQENEK